MKGIPLSPSVSKEKLPGNVVFVDTETREESDGQLTLILGYFEVWRVGPEGLPEFTIREGVFYSEGEFYTLLRESAPCRVIAHNWAFDAAVLRVGSRENMERYGYDIDVGNGIYPAGGSDSTRPFLS